MITDYVKDNGLAALQSGGNLLTLTSSVVTTYAQAFNEAGGGGLRIGSAVPTLTLTDGAIDGRRVTCDAIAAGAIEDDDAVGANQGWAIIDTVNSRLLSYGSVTNDQVVVDGNTFSLTAFDAGVIRD